MEQLFYWYGVFIGSVIMGLLIGLIPLIVGLRMKKTELAITGFVCCLAGSFILGLFLSIPCCIGFTAAILILAKKREKERFGTSESYCGGANGQSNCPGYQSGSSEHPPRCLWHGENDPFSQQRNSVQK